MTSPQRFPVKTEPGRVVLVEWEIKMDPPVNKVLPVSRRRYSDLRKLLGV